MVRGFIILMLLLFVFRSAPGQDNVYQPESVRSIVSVNRLVVSIKSEKPLHHSFNKTDLVYDKQAYLKRASYNLSMLNGFSKPARFDSISIIRTNNYNKAYTHFVSDQKVMYATNGIWSGYKNERVFGRLDARKNTVVLYKTSAQAGYSKIDSLVLNWDVLEAENDIRKMDTSTSFPADTSGVEEHVLKQSNLLKSADNTLRSFLLLNLFTDVRTFYVPIYGDDFWGIRNDWLWCLDTMSCFLSLNQIRDYNHFGKNIGRDSALQFWDVTYNGKTMNLKFNDDHRLSQALITSSGTRSQSDYFFKYAVYEYQGDSLIRINSYELPFSTKDYFNDLLTGDEFENIDENRLKKMKGCRQAVEQLRFEQGKLISYRKKYTDGRREQECLFNYHPVLGLLSYIHQNTIVNPKLRQEEKFTIQVNYK